MSWVRPHAKAPRDIEVLGQGMRVKGTTLFLDAQQQTDLSFVSHAHGDHIARHRQVIATKATLAFMQHRLGRIPTALTAPYRQKFTLGNLGLELFPAGHILGSAQLRVTRADRRIVYTGDLNYFGEPEAGRSRFQPALTAEAAEAPECEVLVLESTFGHPRYRFPPRAETFARMAAWAREAIADGVTPVFLAYTLGKSQEAMKALEREGFALVAHASIADMCDLYAAHGQPLRFRRYDRQVEPGEVLIFPANLAKADSLAKAGPQRKAMLTGWALDGEAHLRNGADVAFPLSDHADFEGLVAFAKATTASQIWTVHGFAVELAAALRDRGMNAQPLIEPKQLEMF